mgnify:CR=1 FL=1
MAEIAIPMAALGIMYILSNEKKDEGFSGISSSEANREGLVNTNIPPKNYPVEIKEGRDDRYTNQKYSGLNKNTNKTSESAEVRNETEDYNNTYTSLTGETKNYFDFEHNNMKPFFGSNVTQTTDSNSRDGILDLYTGSGSQQIQKKANAPFFKPQKNMQWINGMPSTSDFMQERMRGNVSSKMNNAKPWEEIQVGPGLNKGFSSEDQAVKAIQENIAGCLSGSRKWTEDENKVFAAAMYLIKEHGWNCNTNTIKCGEQELKFIDAVSKAFGDTATIIPNALKSLLVDDICKNPECWNIATNQSEYFWNTGKGSYPSVAIWTTCNSKNRIKK